MKLYMFRTVRLSIIRSLLLYTQQWCMLYRFVESFRAGPGWNSLVLLESCLQTYMTYTISECAVNKPLMMDRRTVRNMWSFMTNKFVKFVHLVGFITKKFVMMHGHMNVKYVNVFLTVHHELTIR